MDRSIDRSIDQSMSVYVEYVENMSFRGNTTGYQGLWGFKTLLPFCYIVSVTLYMKSIQN
jgi:hypothetical protein